MKIDELARIVEEIAPMELQEEWDHSGWQLKLTDGDRKSLYEKKNFEQWVKQAKKQAEKNAGTADEWAALR